MPCRCWCRRASISSRPSPIASRPVTSRRRLRSPAAVSAARLFSTGRRDPARKGIGMRQIMHDDIETTLEEIRTAGLYMAERVITSPQGAHIRLSDAGEVINLCANNYLGLADHPTVVAAARTALDQWGFGMASVRFICGTQAPHKHLEQALSSFLGTADTILYSSCFDANG